MASFLNSVVRPIQSHFDSIGAISGTKLRLDLLIKDRERRLRQGPTTSCRHRVPAALGYRFTAREALADQVLAEPSIRLTSPILRPIWSICLTPSWNRCGI